MITVTNPLKKPSINSKLPFLIVSKADNQTYWDAVKLCNEKYKE